MTDTMHDYLQRLGQESLDTAPVAGANRQAALWDRLTGKQAVIQATKIVKLLPDGAMTSWHPNAAVTVYRVGDIYSQEALPYNRGGLYVFAGSIADNRSLIEQVVGREFVHAPCVVLDCLAAGPFQFYDFNGNYIGDRKRGPAQYRDGQIVEDYRSIKIACSHLWVQGVICTILPTVQPKPAGGADGYTWMTHGDFLYK